MSVSEGRLRAIESATDRVSEASVATSSVELRSDLSIAEFMLSDRYLAQRHVFPPQLTFLKTVFLEVENFTAFDRHVIDEWSSGFQLGQPTADGLYYEGSSGTTPDIDERMAQLRAEGRWHFEEVINVLGRRGSKGYLGGVCAARIVWDLICGPPFQERFGIPATKRLMGLVFAGQKEQATSNQFRDLADLVENAPCLAPFVAERTASSLLLFLPHQLGGRRRPKPDKALLEIRAVPAKPLAGRGPAVIMALFDEMAHMRATGANRGAGEVFAAARPSLAQFGHDAFVYQASSPWTTEGRFYENARASCAVDPVTRKALQPEVFAFQGPSWSLYKDHELTHDEAVAQYPGGPPLPPTPAPIIEETSSVVVHEKRYHVENYRPEYLGEWAAVLDAYLPLEDIAAAFGPWGDRILTIQQAGALGTAYHAHGDPSVSGANFGFVIAHREFLPGDPIPYTVFDVLHAWEPETFGGRIDYLVVEGDIRVYLVRFPIETLSFDQYNSPGIIQRLQRELRTANLPRHTQVFEQTATATSNWNAYEVLKTSLAIGHVHFPTHDLARLELEHLQRRDRKIIAPTGGPVQTKDIADSIAQVTYRLMNEYLTPGLSDVAPIAYQGTSGRERSVYADQFSKAGRRGRGLPHDIARQQYPARVPFKRNP